MDQYQILLKHSHTGNQKIVEIGLDEAGRGALSGPVTVAACIMPFGFQHELIKDSKLLSEPQRVDARRMVLENALAWSIVHIPVEEIESTNILKATLNGMKQCLDNVAKDYKFDFILVDGDQWTTQCFTCRGRVYGSLFENPGCQHGNCSCCDPCSVGKGCS